MIHFRDKYFRISSIFNLEKTNRKYRNELLPVDGGWFTFGEEVAGATMNEILKKSNISLRYFLVV